MKRLWQGLSYLCLIAGLFACAAPQQTVTTTAPQQTVTTTAPQQTVTTTAPQQTVTTTAPQPTTKAPSVLLGELPCTTMDGAGMRAITYPAESLYRSGAALPRMEGLACLDVLAEWIKPFEGNPWQINVSGEDGHGFDPEKLAAKRQELLQRYFHRKGIDTTTWKWQVTVNEEFQLELRGSL